MNERTCCSWLLAFVPTATQTTFHWQLMFKWDVEVEKMEFQITGYTKGIFLLASTPKPTTSPCQRFALTTPTHVKKRCASINHCYWTTFRGLHVPNNQFRGDNSKSVKVRFLKISDLSIKSVNICSLNAPNKLKLWHSKENIFSYVLTNFYAILQCIPNYFFSRPLRTIYVLYKYTIYSCVKM